MQRVYRKDLYNNILLIGGLILLRLPRLFGLGSNPWVLLLTLVPFWFVIINNHQTDMKITQGPSRGIIIFFLQAFLLFNIFGILVLISVVFVKAFVDQQSVIYIYAAIILFVGFLFGSVWALRAYFSELKFDPKIAVFGSIYFLLIIISILRTSVSNPYLLLFVYQLITYIVFALSTKCVLSGKKVQYLTLLVIGLILYFTLNIILDWSGVTNPASNYLREYESVLLSVLGLDTFRVYFPIAEGINSFGMVAGAGISFSVAALVSLIVNRSSTWKKGLTAGIGLVICIYIVIVTDSRGGLLFGFVSAGLFTVFRRFKYNAIVTAILSIQPLVLISTGNLLQYIPFLARFSRAGTDVLSGRSLIWKSAVDHLSVFEPIHLFGYGIFGQNTSGVIEKYQGLFISYVNSEMIDFHNFSLQTIFDSGYLGLIITGVLFYFIGTGLLKKINKYSANIENSIAFSGFLYLILIGSVSVIPAFYASELYYLFPFIWVTAGTNYE